MLLLHICFRIYEGWVRSWLSMVVTVTVILARVEDALPQYVCEAMVHTTRRPRGFQNHMWCPFVRLSRSKINSPRPIRVAEQAAQVSQPFGTLPLHSQSKGWATNPPIHTWRIPSTKGKHVRAPKVPNSILVQPLWQPPFL